MAKVLLLIVEDQVELADMYASNFKNQGFEVDIAHDGHEGFEKMKSERPSLVLMDIIMPGLSGLEAIELAKHEPSTKDIPIIILTNLPDSIEVQNAMRLGAADCIVKANFTPLQVVEKAKKFLAPPAEPKGSKHRYLSS
jgi:DNA-binding response OmpR family regulator